MEQLGGYRLVALLGEGGMGRVHLGRAASGRLVAVKTVHEHLAADTLFRERFRREAAAARSVAGPFTAAVLDADPEAVRPWLATEFCTGPTLTGAVTALGPLASGELAALGAALAEAVAAVHAVGLVHRDLKPSNIVVTRDGPMVIDFGIARTAADESLTHSGEVVGSPGFIAPELLTGTGEPGPAVDVFALGALLAYAATGRPPFGTGPVHQVLYRTMHGPADLDGPAGTPDGSARWRELLESCLSREPGDRPTPAEVLAACAAWTEGDPWWEREAVSGLIRRREEEVAELVARASGAAADAPAGDVAPDVATGARTGAPRTTLAPGAGATTVLSGARGTSRRRFLRWGGAALVGGSAIGAVAWLTELTGDGDGDKGKGDAADPATAVPSGPYTLGRALWTRDIGEARPIRHGDALYLRDENALTRLDPRSGAVAWSYPAEGITDAVPGDELVHVLRAPFMFSTEITALDAATGGEKWSANPLVRNPHRPLELRESADDDPVTALDGEYATLSVSAGTLCIATYSSYSTMWARRAGKQRPWRAYGYDPRSGASRWFHQGTSAEVVALHQRDGRIGVVATTGSSASEQREPDEPLAVLRAADGTLEREISGGARYPESYLGARGVRHYATDGRLRAVDLASRRTRWTRELSEEESDTDTTITPTAHAGLVHTATYNTLRALDADTGRTRWSLTDVGLPKDGALLVADGLVYGHGTAPKGQESSADGADWGVHARDAATGRLVWAAGTGEVRTVLVGTGSGAESAFVHVVSTDGTLSTFAAPAPTTAPTTTPTPKDPA